MPTVGNDGFHFAHYCKSSPHLVDLAMHGTGTCTRPNKNKKTSHGNALRNDGLHALTTNNITPTLCYQTLHVNDRSMPTFEKDGHIVRSFQILHVVYKTITPCLVEISFNARQRTRTRREESQAFAVCKDA